MKRLKHFAYFEPLSVKEAARAAADEVSPITDLRCSASYRKEMVKVLTYRALIESMQKAKKGMPE